MATGKASSVLIQSILFWKQSISQSITATLFISFICYLVLVSQLRFHRAHRIRRKYVQRYTKALLGMTNDDAHAIIKDLVEMEFPKLMGLSIVFALFKTYGIPSVSSLLLSTGQLADTETASRRVADTGVLIFEFAFNSPSSERAIKSIARMNFLHGRYQKAGKISNDDMLYTLSLFALEPARWIERHEWRSLTDVEKCAFGTFWKAMGDAMLISYAPLKSVGKGWTNGIQWLKEVDAWSKQYEKENMIPAKSNQLLAEKHLDLLFLNLPTSLRIWGKQLTGILVGERVQRAMMLPTASVRYHRLVQSLFWVRKTIIRYLFLPRPELFRKQYLPKEPDDKSGRYNAIEYLSHPWYVKPTFKRRWSPRALVTRLLGRRLPGDDGNRYAPEGYTFDELGPQSMKNKGHQEMFESEKYLKKQERSQCPFHT